jgi:hypothetical protein
MDLFYSSVLLVLYFEPLQWTQNNSDLELRHSERGRKVEGSGVSRTAKCIR